VTWIRFAIWLVVGLVIYFTYGYQHSTLRRRAASAASPS
jgi:basic amino acid/polyamine antiporter, APA family